MSPALTSCQYVAGQILQTSAGSPLDYLSLIPLLLLVKILLSVLAQQLHFQELPKEARQLPKKLRHILAQHHINPHSIRLSHSSELEAYVVGVLTPVIVLSRSALQKLSLRQLEAVVLHERFHQKNRHPFIFMLSSACAAVCWFLPSVKELAEIIQERCELAADQFAITTQGTERYLLGALRTCLHSTPAPAPAPALAAIPALQSQLLHQRIAQLTNTPARITSVRRMKIGNIVFSAIISLFLIGLAAIHPHLSVASQAPNHCSFAECIAQCVSERISSSRQSSPGLYSPVTIE